MNIINLKKKVSNNECTYFEYYTKCKELLENMINMFSSEYIYSTNYASELTEKYLEQISECKKKITILTAMGDKNSKIDINNLDKNPDILNFHELLRDFDSRIDGKLALTLFSNSLPDIIGNSEYLKLLGVTTSNNPKRLKFKREKSGYISNFFGIDYSYISPKSELQVMSINEHQESTTGYSAHSNMPGKEANFMEIPTAYKDNNIKLLKSLGQNNLITNQELHLINLISSIKPISKEYMKLFQALVNKDYIHFEDKVPKGINLPDEYIPALKKFCHLTKIEKNKLEQLLYERGCNIFDSWAKNVFVK